MHLLVLIFMVIASAFAGPAQASDAPSRLHIFFSGEVGGTFEPCGCAGGPAGGVARRIGFVNDLLSRSGGGVLQLDAGNYFAAPGPDASVINEMLRASLRDIPISVLNLGSEDLYWWPELSRMEKGQAHFVSTNLTPRRGSLPAPEKYAVIEVRLPGSPEGTRPVRIAVLGLTAPEMVKPNSGFQASDPVAAVASVMEEANEKSDFVIVLWDMIRPRDNLLAASPLAQVAALSDRIALILTTEKRYTLYHPVKLGSATLLSSVERGRFLGDALLTLNREGKPVSVEPSFYEMKEGVPEDPRWHAEQARVSAQLRR